MVATSSALASGSATGPAAGNAVDKTLFGKYAAKRIGFVPLWVVVHVVVVGVVALANYFGGTFSQATASGDNTAGFVFYIDDYVNYTLVVSPILVFVLVHSIVKNITSIHAGWTGMIPKRETTKPPFLRPIELLWDVIAKGYPAGRLSYFSVLGFVFIIFLFNQVISPWVLPDRVPISWSMTPFEPYGHVVSFGAAIFWGLYIYVFIAGSLIWYVLISAYSLMRMLFAALKSETDIPRYLVVYPIPASFQPAIQGITGLVIAFGIFTTVIGGILGIYMYLFGLDLLEKIVLVVYFLGVAACLLLPIYLMHLAMRRSRNHRMGDLAGKIIDAYDGLRKSDGSHSDDANEVAQALGEIEAIEKAFGKMAKIPIWPFNVSLGSKFLSVLLTSVLPPVFSWAVQGDAHDIVALVASVG